MGRATRILFVDWYVHVIDFDRSRDGLSMKSSTKTTGGPPPSLHPQRSADRDLFCSITGCVPEEAHRALQSTRGSLEAAVNGWLATTAAPAAAAAAAAAAPSPAVALDPAAAAVGEETRRPWYVLVGGEARSFCGPNLEQRELMHTSLTWVCEAYAKLRSAGVPRERIITIVQLRDYTERTPWLEDGVYPKSMVMKVGARLIAEGGADYDFELVNPGTVVAVLRGQSTTLDGGVFPKVVPRSARAVHLAIYSHGDSHPSNALGAAASAARKAAERTAEKDMSATIPAPVEMDRRNYEWFAHFPYPIAPPSLAAELLSFVSTEYAGLATEVGSGSSGAAASSSSSASSSPALLPGASFLYANQLAATFSHLFADNAARPVTALLNFCRSGGVLHFLESAASRAAYGVAAWPLFVFASSQAEHDALVGGVWQQWFRLIALRIISGGDDDGGAGDASSSSATCERRSDGGRSDASEVFSISTLGEFAILAKREYSRLNAYELCDHTATLAYPSNFGEPGESFRLRLKQVLADDYDGQPDWRAIEELQAAYAARGIRIWQPHQWHGDEVSLVEAVREAQKRCAVPQFAAGSDATLHLSLDELFNEQEGRRRIDEFENKWV